MNTHELIRKSGLEIYGLGRNRDRFIACVERTVDLIREERTKELMQLFLDPENQPTQFGTVTLEYQEKEIANIVRKLK